MESSVSTIVCPNCGANPQNHNNCEYCGSLLVRFADKNIPIVEEKYGSKAFKFDGLKEALTVNLEEQARTNGHNHIHTMIKSWPLVLALDVTNPKSQNELIEYTLSDGTPVIVRPKYTETDEQSLVICIRFYETTKPIKGDGQKKAHDRFKQLDIFPLFSLQVDNFETLEGTIAGKVYQYYLNFGRDIDGAAAIITQYFSYNCNAATADKLKLNYTQSSLTDEEYDNNKRNVNKKKRVAKFGGHYTIILGAIITGLGIFALVTSSSMFEGDELSEMILMSLGVIAIGAFILIWGFKGLHVNLKDKKIR